MVKKMKYKIIFTLIFTTLLLFSVGFTCYAEETTDIYEEYMQSSGADNLIDSVPDEVKDMLIDLGIDEISFESIYNISLKTVLKNVVNIITNRAESPLKVMFLIIGIVILISMSKAFQSSKSIESAFNFLATLVVGFTIIVPISQSLSNVFSAIKLSSDFMLLFIPVFVSLVSVSGNPMLALTYRALTLGVIEVISQISRNILSPFTSMMISLNFVSSITENMHIDKISKLIRNIVVSVMTFIGLIFTTFLGVKGILSTSVDTLSAKGIKFLAGNLIPVIGGAIGDAYTSIVGSLNLLKGAVGIFGIIVVAIINLPIICELCIWIFLLHICEIITDFFGEKNLSVLLNGTLKAIQIVLAILIFNLFLMTISTGIILSLKADL